VSGGQQGILSTWPPPSVALDAYGVRTSVGGDNRYAYLVGTSMATPQVAGLVALMRSAKPSLSAARIVRLIKLTASGCGHYGSGGLGWGLIRSDRALAAAAQRDILAPNSRVRKAKVRRARGRKRLAVLQLKRFDDRSETPCISEIPASGIKSVAVFASINGGPYHRIAKTDESEAPPGEADSALKLRRHRR
jgi:subtilisin family serine protease